MPFVRMSSYLLECAERVASAVEMAVTVPDGLVCFFTSYLYLESVVATWYDHGIISDLQRHKLVFIETQDDAETSLALLNYMKVRRKGLSYHNQL